MSPSIVIILFIFFSCSMSNIVSLNAKNTSSSLIEKACSNTHKNFNYKLCIQVLQSEQKVMMSTTNLVNLSISIIESGISNATNIRTYVENMMKKPNMELNLKGALQDCKLSYDSVIGSLKSALGEIKYDKEYATASYDLLIASTDNIERCKDVVVSKRIEDETILIGNKVVAIFGLSAYEMVDILTSSSS